MMLFLRSLAYNIVFYLLIPLWLILSLPLLVLASRRTLNEHAYKRLSRLLLWLLERIAGLGREVRGLEHLPSGPVIVAVKHQSSWDVFGLTPCFREPAMILKSELMLIPLLGWYARRMKMIPVERGKGRKAILSLMREAERRAAEKREIFIFPEGHRRPPGAPPRYKRGIVALYRRLGIPVVPVALNSGLYWKRRDFMRRPGKVIAQFLPPIEPGLDDDEFMKRLTEAIESASRNLIKEALSHPNPPPAPLGWRSGKP